VEQLKFWDDIVHDPAGNPAPHGEHDWMVERATQMFDQMDDKLGSFFRLMVESKLTDLKNRDGKAGGGFCTSFPSYGLPFIFANFNGTLHDVAVFTHEMGHAYQCYESRNQPLLDYLWPTNESCEIHSMGLEFLTWPHM
jgi:oligoendopeptidase F